MKKEVDDGYTTLPFRERMLLLAQKGDFVGRSEKQIITRAKAFEAYVNGDS